MTRQEASRLNGAKSKGPITAEGKKRSSQNALKHGLCSPFLLLPQEGTEHFNLLAESYLRIYDPQDEKQLELVNEAITCTWRMLRLMGIESSLLEAEIARQRDGVDKKFKTADDHLRIALAFEALANNGKALGLLNRYEARLSRTKHRCLEQLRKLQASEDAPPSPDLPNEPKPDCGAGFQPAAGFPAGSPAVPSADPAQPAADLEKST